MNRADMPEKKPTALSVAHVLAGLFLMFAFSSVLRSALPESAGPAQNSLTPAEVIERFIQASGGPALDKIKTEKKVGTLVRGANGPVPFETIADASGKWSYTQVFAFGDRVRYVFDGSRAWIQDGGGVSELPRNERLELALLLDIRAPLKLRRLFPKMTVKGSEKIGEKDAVVLAAVSEDGLNLELAFDRATGLLLRAGDLYFEDYRDVGKAKRPFLVFFGKDAAETSLRLKMQAAEIKPDVEIDKAAFTEPACALPPVAPVLYALKKEVPIEQESLKALVGVYQSDADPKVLFTVMTQGPHLMIEQTGWGVKLEILPESSTDFFMRFLHLEFHFVKDSGGRVTGLEIGPDRAQKATRIKEPEN